MEKMTKRQRFEALLTLDAVKEDAEMVTFLQHEIELLSKKTAKQLAAQLAAEDKLAEIMDFLVAEAREVAYAELQAHVGLSPQKIAPLMTKLEAEGKVVRKVEKRVTYFKAVA